MRYAEALYGRFVALIRAEQWEGWYKNRPELFRDRRDKRWRVYCGDGRFDTLKKNALFSKSNQVALNFQVVGAEEVAANYEFSLTWPDGWQLMYHWDKVSASWPLHPEHHVQFEAPKGAIVTNPPPFVHWRLPSNENQPERILEYLITQLLSP